MKEDIKNKLVAALKSGEYEHGFDYLRSKNGLCCTLGVLCDLYANEHPEAVWLPSEDCYIFSTGDSFNIDALAPEVVKWAGMSNRMGSCKRDSLTSINDREETFEPVIEFIEEHWRDL